MSILGALTGAAVQATLGKVVDGITDAYKSYNAKKISEAELRARVESELMAFGAIVAREGADIIKAEIASDSWLARNWRPIVALTAFGSLVWVVIAIPHLVAWFGVPAPSFGEAGLGWFFTITSISIGGYVGGRSLEKIARIVTGK